MPEAKKCPRCKKFYLGDQCYICTKDVPPDFEDGASDIPQEVKDIFGPIFGGFNDGR